MRAVTMAVLGLAMSMPLAAQQHGEPAMGGPMMMDMDMMHGGIGAMLALRGPLALTTEQVARLEALQEAASGEAMHHEHMATGAQHQAMEAIHHGAVDLAAHEAKLEEAAQHRTAAMMSRARRLAEARELLTPEQREKLDFAMEAVRALMGMHGGAAAGGHQH